MRLFLRNIFLPLARDFIIFIFYNYMYIFFLFRLVFVCSLALLPVKFWWPVKPGGRHSCKYWSFKKKKKKTISSLNKRLPNNPTFIFTLARYVQFLYFPLLKIQFETSELPELTQIHRRDGKCWQRKIYVLCFIWDFRKGHH